MRVMVIVKASRGSEAGEMPSQELLTAMGNFNEELVKAGLMLDGAGLKPTSAGARVHFSGSNRTVIDGPFTETKELVAGYWIWKVDSLQQAIDWVKRCPNPMLEDSDIEIRPFYEAEDFGEALTPEMREQEAAILASSLGLNFPSFQDRPPMRLVGLLRSYNMETRIAIPQQWKQFVNLSNSLPQSRHTNYYGVSLNTKGNCDFDYLCAFEADQSLHAEPLPTEFTQVTIEPHRFAIFAHTAHVSTLPKTLELIWQQWAKKCDLDIANGPCVECYTTDFDANTGMGGMEVWIPLKTPQHL